MSGKQASTGMSLRKTGFGFASQHQMDTTLALINRAASRKLTICILLRAAKSLDDGRLDTFCLPILPAQHSFKGLPQVLTTGHPRNPQSPKLNGVSRCQRQPWTNSRQGRKGSIIDNRSDGHRTGFAIRYLAPHVRQARSHYKNVLVRGEDAYRYHDLLKRPPSGQSKDCLAAYETFKASWPKNRYVLD